jgi:hypothetical protein
MDYYGLWLTKDRPVLSSERAPHMDRTNFSIKINIWSWAPDGARHQDRLIDRQFQCDSKFEGSSTQLHSRQEITAAAIVRVSTSTRTVDRRLCQRAHWARWAPPANYHTRRRAVPKGDHQSASRAHSFPARSLRYSLDTLPAGFPWYSNRYEHLLQWLSLWIPTCHKCNKDAKPISRESSDFIAPSCFLAHRMR